MKREIKTSNKLFKNTAFLFIHLQLLLSFKLQDLLTLPGELVLQHGGGAEGVKEAVEGDAFLGGPAESQHLHMVVHVQPHARQVSHHGNLDRHTPGTSNIGRLTHTRPQMPPVHAFLL